MRTRIRPVGPDVHVRGGVTDTSAGSGQRPAGAPDRTTARLAGQRPGRAPDRTTARLAGQRPNCAPDPTTVRFASSPVVPVTGLSPTRRP
jgi:hypothetical protein